MTNSNCVYLARNEEMVREHAKQGGFPANCISQVRTIIDPTTGGRLILQPADELHLGVEQHFIVCVPTNFEGG